MTSALTRVVHHLRRTAVRDDVAGLADGDLLERYLARRDEAAFETLLRRHGPMVLAVCRRILRNQADAEDAFQATFLILVRKASNVRPRSMVSNWLYGVAHNTALKAKTMIRKRYAKEKEAGETTKPGAADEVWSQVQGLVDAELLALPDKYRVPVILCDLEGKTIKEAAQHLGWPPGTVATRLRRGRQMLARRLSARGLALSGAGLTAALSQGAASATVRARLLDATLNAANVFATGQAAAGVISSKVAALTQGVLNMMFLTKLKNAMAVLLAVGVLAATSGTLSYGRWGAAPGAPEARAETGPAPRAEPGDRDPVIEPNKKGGADKTAGAGPDARRPVALLFDDIPITRAELGEYLIARYGARKIEFLVNLRIVEHFCAKNGVAVTEHEIDAALDEDLAELQMNRTDFENNVLRRFDKTLYEWREDVIRPKLLLGKLSRQKITVAEDDLRQMFEHLYGQKVRCKVIFWPKAEENVARRMYEEIRRSDEAFDRAARSQSLASLAANGGAVPPVARYSHNSDRALEEEAFKLKPGEVSPLRTMQDGQLFVVKCVGHVPPVEGKDFVAERPRLMQEVINRKISVEIPKLFQTYRDQARPRILLK